MIPLDRDDFEEWLAEDSFQGAASTEKHIGRAVEFATACWAQRALERGMPPPADLSHACKFCTLFVKGIFGGSIKGNFDHQFNVIDGERFDLSSRSADVIELFSAGRDPYAHDKNFFGSEDHIESMLSCVPRVNQWIEKFLQECEVQLGDRSSMPRFK